MTQRAEIVIITLTVLLATSFVGAEVDSSGMPPLLREPNGTPVTSVPHNQFLLLNTTDSAELPRVLMLVRPCTGDKENFCVNGVCTYDPELNSPSCTCPPNFTGVRCQHILMNSHGQESQEELIAIGIGVSVLLCGLSVALYCCLKKRCKNKKQAYQMCNPDRAV